MSKIIKYIATIEEVSGRVVNVAFPQGVLPPEGSKEGFETVHVTEDMIPEGFMQQGVSLMEFHWDGLGFVRVGKPPNRFATYNGTDWTWDAELLLGDIRKIRNAKLTASDWTQVVDAPITDEQKAEWRLYRQELRDFPSTLDNPSSLEELQWPVPPTA